MTTEIGYGVDVNHKSSQNMATFQTKLLRSINLMVFHFYSNFSGAQTFLPETQRNIFATTSSSNNFEAKPVKY